MTKLLQLTKIYGRIALREVRICLPPKLPGLLAPPGLPRLPNMTDNPLHKAISDLQTVVRTARDDLSGMVCSLKGSQSSSSCNIRASVKSAETKKETPVFSSPASFDIIETPTESETIVALKDRLREQITGAEDDLAHNLKINGKACTCMEGRHNVQIKALAREVMEKEPDNPIFQEVIDWISSNEPRMTARASASGQYDKEYPKMANELGNFRRKLTKEISGNASVRESAPVKDAKEFIADLKAKQGG